MRLQDLFEGGNALKNVETIRINRSDVPETIKYVSSISGIPLGDLHAIGSTGKTPTSGDVDIAIDETKYDPQTVHTRMLSRVGPDRAVFNKGMLVGSYGIPIAGNEANGLVQVDFMYVKNPEWAKFSYYSSGERSKYKGVVRTILLRSVAASLDEKGTDVFIYDPQTNDLIVRIGRVMDMNVGMRRIIQMRQRKASGNEYLKTMKPVSLEDIESAFPELNVRSKIKSNIAVIDNPNEALAVMFGRKVSMSDVETAEQVVDLISQLPSQQRQRATNIARDALVNSKQLTPEQVDQLLRT